MHKLFENSSITLFLSAFCAFLWLKSPFNQHNPRLMNYLHALGIFTTVEKSLQIAPFMQNEPNFRKSQMYINKVLTKDYEEMDTWSIGKNEPKTNPKRTQNEPKTNPMQTQTNPISEQKNAAAFEYERPAYLDGWKPQAHLEDGSLLFM